MNDAMKPPMFKPGAPAIRAADLNAMRDAIPALITGGPGIIVTRVGKDRYTIRLASASSAAPGAICTAVITEVRDAYTICDKDGALVAVAKPWGMRRNAQWPAGASYEYESGVRRTATSGGTTETQLITPDYTVGEELLIARLASARINDDEGLPIVWLDTNNCGRCWATPREAS